MGKFIDLTGQKFGRLTVVKRVEDVRLGRPRWLCKCDCGNECIVTSHNLKNGTKSCGCLKSENTIKLNQKKKKTNRYENTKDYMIGYDCNNKPFIFDKEDYDKIKDYCWWVDKKGYVSTIIINREDKKHHTLKIHRIITNCPNDMVVDHINHNPSDNRRENLRICTYQQNSWNQNVRCNNKLGIKGVYEHNGKYVSAFQSKYLGIFNTIEEAQEAYDKEAQRRYGEFYYKKGDE